MLITLVQGIIGTFDEHLAPFEEAGSQKRRDHAENDLLRESAVHPCI